MAKEKETVRVSHLPEHGPLDENGREILLSLKNVDITFGKGDDAVRAVKNASFDIYKGETFSLVGESGSGKTTIGRAICRINPTSGGDIFFKGQKINGKISKELDKEVIRKIQMIFQDPVASLNPRMTVKEIISEGLIINGIRDKEYLDQKVYEILELVGLTREHAGRYPHEFSGGQKQRIGIARSVIMHPDLLIADEPVSALDVSIQAQVINLLNDLREQLGLTILFIAHDLSVVKYFSDRIGVMYFGKMVELASSDELFAHPLHPYTKSLLSAIPLPDPISEKKRTRMRYDPLSAHDYNGTDQPSLREVAPGHFVHCNDAEYMAYRREMGL